MSEVYAGAVDRGLEGVIACTTAISSIVDTTLCFRGYTIEDLAENSNFEEVVFLLWNNRLPKADELASFCAELSKDMGLDAELVKQLQALPTKDVHPMAWLRTGCSMLALWDKEAQGETEQAQKNVAMRLTARMGTLVALFERTRQGKAYVAPKADKSLAWNFLYMMTGEEPDADTVRVFDVCLILHADHELNCSAFSARVTSSSLSDIYSAVTSAIGALKGPLHGGANEQVMRMLKEIGTVDGATKWVREALDQKKKVMGFGHRVYKNGDPRAKILSGMSQMMTKKTNQAHWFEMSKVIHDTVEREKGLLPNVDFYSATVYYSLGIPLDLYTPIFAVSRVSGWLAHIFEQYANNRIYRPRGQWTGNEGLKWVPASDR
ncbi:MAG: citrate synthase [Bdellovibrionaceae bacterium]|nr:citrate synthase [Bdellovibrionales bacterium]MCB9084927.1 citrate synthase [Pseudobdellovibrionaceae bacterium]